MKKLFGLMLVLALALTITGCGFRPSYIDDVPDIIIIIPVGPVSYDVIFNSDGGTEIVPITIDEDDIYDTAFIGYTLMYGSAEGQDELLPILRPFDLYNLAYIYNVIQEEETEE